MKKLKFPNYIKKIRIDVGTGSTAPNTSLWLKNSNNTAVLCFEADPRSFNILMKGGKTNQYPENYRLFKKKYILLKNKKVKKIDPRIIKIFNIAISLKEKKKNDFYLTDKKNFGTSSLLKPIEKSLNQKVVKKIQISVKKISFYLKKIDFKKFKYIEFLKIDTQGNDLNVLKSCDRYLKKICFVQAEYWAYKSYKGEKTRKECLREIKEFMKRQGFSMYYFTITDVFFVNESLKKNILSNYIIDSSVDFEKGLYNKSFFLNLFPGKLVMYASIIIFLRKFRLFNFLFYKILRIKFKKLI
jgi:hypothetical protein